jgi:hypothetical protein
MGLLGWLGSRHLAVQDRIIGQLGNHEVRITVLEERTPHGGT